MRRNKYMAWIFLAVCSGILLLGGCSGKEGEAASEKRTVELSEIGITYQTPDIWRKYEETSLYPRTFQSEGFLARIQYNFITEETLELLKTGNPADSLADQMTPICEVAVLPEENVETAGAANAFSMYQERAELGRQQGYVYYLLTGTTGDLSGFSTEQRQMYDEMAAAAPEIAGTVVLSAFDAEAFQKKSDTLPNALTFQTETLYEEPIDSTLFADYKLTMVNFGGTYAYDESAELQRLYQLLKEKKEFHLLTAYIDTPEVTTNKEGLALRKAAGASYDTIVMDEILANWATENLNGVPTTVFVNSDGVIISEKLEGAKTAEEYLAAMEEAAKGLSK